MKRMHVLSVLLPALAPTALWAQSFTYNYTFATPADQNEWTITTDNDFVGPGVPEFGIPDETSVRIAPIDAGTKNTGDIRLYRQVQAPAGFVFANLVFSGIGMGYSSHVTWADLLLSPDGEWGTTNTDPDVIRGRAAASYDEAPIVANASGVEAYTNLSSIFLQIRIVDGLAAGNPATNSPYARAISLSGDLIPDDTPVPGSEWNLDGSGDWNNLANWKFGAPNAIGASAGFLGKISATQTVYTNTGVTVGKLLFDNANTYVLAGGGSLTIETSSGAGSINVAQGSHKINLPLFFASDTSVAVAEGASLTIADPATINAAKTVTTNGTVLIQAPLTIQAGGALVVGGGAASLFGAPSLEAGAKVDLKTNDLAIDYRGLAGQADAVKAQLASGYNSGAWNGEGINTSSAIAGETGLGWMDDAANQQVLIKYTYQGDATLDGKVDVGDLGALASNWQLAANWSGGDFDYSGTVNVGDLGILATNWQKGSSNPLGPSFSEALAALGLPGVSVPEPASLGLIALAMGAMQLRRRTRA